MFSLRFFGLLFFSVVAFGAPTLYAFDIENVKQQERVLCVVIAERGHFNPMLHLCMHLAQQSVSSYLILASTVTNSSHPNAFHI